VSRAHEIGGAAYRLAEGAGIDEVARALVGAAQEGIWRGADAQALGPGRLHEFLALRKFDAERLFRIDVLAGRDGAQTDIDMSAGDRQVEDDLDRGIVEYVVQRHRLETVRGGRRLSGFRVEVGYGPDVEDRKALGRLEIGAGDIAKTDDADTHAVHDLFRFVAERVRYAQPPGGAGGAPGRAVEFAERHCRRAARPELVGDIVHDDLGHVAERLGQGPRKGLPERLEDIIA